MLFGLAMLVSQKSYAQARIGYSEKEIVQDCKENNWECKVDFLDKEKGKPKTKIIQVTTPPKGKDGVSFVTTHLLDKDDICVLSFIYPNNNKALNSLVQYYNSEYVQISDTKWKNYTSSGIFNANLVIDEDDNSFYFVWSKQEKKK